mmetsp:Transcript_154418/g.474602  ORF Transcript_154418/g.474602 Transcript_154418/m.474602 type:complete len:593 (-) Transcript_154418:33-1811(-)|eukprot:CAMPEP_0204585938 /NCGR_PEP_ID=MMETSP0661-20131031/47202_1 /ASSEMBLY_ACC=CAM_ASM_000606 /TAXON_ID=109239 /ORGANISM="Alexandrium margalefi, Strain AMGDE01CS-322" /LENGTH=592 /DNA_ID=CAMNT_0051595533 /DNA_START=45 /DNA_END=1823 /DNA_ORIENTATION=+
MVLSSVRRANLILGSPVLLPLLGNVLAHDDNIDQVLEELLEAGRFEDECAGGKCTVSMRQKTIALHRQRGEKHNASGKSLASVGVKVRSKELPARPQLASASISRSISDTLAPSFFQLGATKSKKTNSSHLTGALHGRAQNAHRPDAARVDAGKGNHSRTPDPSAFWAAALWEESMAGANAIPGSAPRGGVPAATQRPDSQEASQRGASLEADAPTATHFQPEPLRAHHHAVVLAMLLAVLFVLLGVATAMLWRALHVSARVQAIARWKRRKVDSVRPHIEAMPVCPGSEVDRQLPASCGYDCALSKPVSSGRPLRLQAHVVGPLAGSALTAPLSQRACVHFTASVSEKASDRASPVPVASCTEGVGFLVSLVDAPDVRIEVCGQDISLFDVRGGRLRERQGFAAAPEHWQDFTLFHRTLQPVNECQASFLRSKDSPALDFEEHALLVGADVTLVGELLRDASGKLSLQPWPGELLQPIRPPSAGREAWRTSWERNGDCEAGLPEQPPSTDSPQGCVFASDDPLLFHSPAQDVAPEPHDGWNTLREAFSAAVAAAASWPRAIASTSEARSCVSDPPPQDKILTDEMSPPMYV